MRKTLNENPVVQVVMLGILGIVVAFLFMTRIMGQKQAEDTTPAVDPATASTAPASAVPATDAPAAPATGDPAASAPADPAAPAPADPVTGAPGVGFEAGAGLPESVVRAYDGGDVVALLVVNRKGTEDRRLESEVRALGRGDTSVFVVEAKNVARYSRIAEGVNLDRVPALVVIEPKSRAKGDLPAASISYGFRGPESVAQAINDALYKGKELPFHPG